MLNATLPILSPNLLKACLTKSVTADCLPMFAISRQLSLNSVLQYAAGQELKRSRQSQSHHRPNAKPNTDDQYDQTDMVLMSVTDE